MFDPQLLRSFTAVAETLSFTRAAERLGLSQPTVSQHVQRLESAAGRALVQRDTRQVALTDNGRAMLGFARGILAAHDGAAAYFSGSAMRGRLRFGSADDLAQTELPRILRRFRRVHPQINLELTVAQSGMLARRLAAGALDLVFVKQESGAAEGRLVRRERLVWVAHRDLEIDPTAPLPLVAYQAPSLSRSVALQALEDAGRSWRITCTVREINGVHAALRAGLGVTVLPQNLVPENLRDVTAQLGLPLLREIDFTLLDNPRAPREPVEALVAAIIGTDGPAGARHDR
ncbi:LysR family transcriptional regulator [Schumannella luteola]|uniref:DNA-binding transcriptional LysR family regulator n=1 Tax=Schumannella luteola TaxID=472059 RepID=A0A852YAI9_9MICO|nr:DNA-binding transcriptional LysR family regulator [Schumannella luteola]TPX03835.1 LysR family transcriptional regulator [Schumannella luteola]